MPRKKEDGVLCKWTVCKAKQRTGQRLVADIMMHDQVIDSVSVTSTEDALRSIARDYMSRLAPSNPTLETRRNRFCRELKIRYGLDQNDVADGDRALDIDLAISIRDCGWSLQIGVDRLLREIAEKRDLVRIR